jgi:hypothetical protein
VQGYRPGSARRKCRAGRCFRHPPTARPGVCCESREPTLTREGPMQRTRFIEHGGKRILLLDFTGLTPQTALPVIAEARSVVARQPEDGSLLTCTDVTGATYDQKVIDALKELSTHNRPYVRAAAVVVERGLKRALLSLVALFSRRKLHPAATSQEALDWLAAQ